MSAAPGSRLPRQGDVVFATVSDPDHQNAKRRPLIVISKTSDITQDGKLVGVCVTSTFAEPLTPHILELPWAAPPARCGTGLTKKCVAHCKWVREIDVSRVESIAGHVPSTLMKKIIELVSDADGPITT